MNAITERAFFDELEKIAGIGSFLRGIGAGWQSMGKGLSMAAKAGKSPGLIERFRGLKILGSKGPVAQSGVDLAGRIGMGARMIAKPVAIAGAAGVGLYGAGKALGQRQPQQVQQRY